MNAPIADTIAFNKHKEEHFFNGTSISIFYTFNQLSLSQHFVWPLTIFPYQVDLMLEELKDDLPSSDVVGTGPCRDVWILRFLMAFNWDIQLACEEFRKMLCFREKYGIDDIRKK